MRYFVDREDPSSDAVHRAGSVLRYVAEKRCPELGLQGAALLHGAARGSMPAQLFAIRQPTGAAPALPDATMQDARLPEKVLKDASVEPHKVKEADGTNRAVQAHAAQALATPQRRPSFLKRRSDGESPEVLSTGSKGSVTAAAAEVEASLLKRAKKPKTA